MNAANASIPSQLENERRAHEPSMEEILASIRKIIADDDALPLSRPSAAPRLFETNVTPFAPPPQPTSARAEPPPRAEAQVRGEPAAPEQQSAWASEPPVEDRVPPAAPEVRLDASEMASFAEVGRELARLDAPAQSEEDVEQGEALRATLDAPADDEPADARVEMAAIDASDDAEVNPVPHEESYEEPFASVEPAAPERLIPPEPPRFFEATRDHRAFVAANPPAAERPSAGAGAMLSAEANASVASAFQALSASVQIASVEAVDRHVRDMLRPMLKQWLDDNLPVMVERLVRAEIERVARGGR